MEGLDQFEPDYVYHIYSHANGDDVLFIKETNFRFFLSRLQHYILPIADIYAYCLMPNHFHLLVRFKDATGITHTKLMQPFKNLLNSYTKAFNKRNNRRGALFLDFLKRKRVTDENYLLNLVHYIHNNPVNHGFVENIIDWKYSSYQAFLSNKKSVLCREDILEFFESIDDFIAFHHRNVDEDFTDLET